MQSVNTDIHNIDLNGAGGSAPFLELRNAVVRRTGKEILSIDSMVLPEGESIAILGPNGAGKSTFVGLISRDILPLHRDEPPVLFRGDSRATLQDVKKAIGYVSSSMQSQITVHLTAREVVAGGLFGSLGVPKRFAVEPDQWQQATDVMDELGIGALADRDIMTLSTGQARRVLIARSLVHSPDVLVFDEPCTGLDPEGMYYVRKTMRHVAQSGRAIMLVTHYLEDIIPEIDRVVLVKDGRLIADGNKQDTLTSSNISSLFDTPLKVIESNGYYSLEMHY